MLPGNIDFRITWESDPEPPRKRCRKSVGSDEQRLVAGRDQPSSRPDDEEFMAKGERKNRKFTELHTVSKFFRRNSLINCIF